MSETWLVAALTRGAQLGETPEIRAWCALTLDALPASFVLTLRWTCQACGWTTTMDAPGFAGDGRNHFPDGRTPCGPITAQKVAA